MKTDTNENKWNHNTSYLNIFKGIQITYPSSQHRKEITVNTDEEEESSLWGVLNLVYSVRKFTRYLILLLAMVFIATFNNISAILWRSVLLMEENEVSAKNHQPVASH